MTAQVERERKKDVVEEYVEIGNLERDDKADCYLRKNRNMSVNQTHRRSLEDGTKLSDGYRQRPP